ncbi:MAG: hypothetical protein ACLFNW_02650 [Desulfobacterales bacterium]
MNNTDKTDDLISRLNEYLDFINVLESKNNKSLKENTIDYINFQKHFIASHKIEKIVNEIFEKDDNDGGNDIDEIDRQTIKYIKKINTMGMTDTNPSNQLILLAMKSIILSSLYSQDENRKQKLIQTSITLKRLLE